MGYQQNNFATLDNTSPKTHSWGTPAPSVLGIGSYQMFTHNTAKCRDTAVIIVVQDVTKWTGTTSKNWHTFSNWNTNRVSGPVTHGIIDSGTPNICELSESDVNVSSVQVNAVGILNVINSRIIHISASCSPLPQPN